MALSLDLFKRRLRASASPLDEPMPAVADIKAGILSKIVLNAGKDVADATKHDWYVATVLTLRDRIVHRWLRSNQQTLRTASKRVHYLSLEFLIGRLMRDSLSNMEAIEPFRRALEELGVDLDELRQVEPDAGLGNGGLGRLAACFMESMASLAVPAIGYGIRYEHGLFRQIISDGRQEEFPEQWLVSGNPWEFERTSTCFDVRFGGELRRTNNAVAWTSAETIQAVAYDTPVVGWRGRHINTLRLWSARAVDPLRLDTFNSGDHLGAVSEMARAEAICKFLYPSDETDAGRELRLRQEYFFVSASLQDIVRSHLAGHGEISNLASHVAIQLNDTHPSLAVPELMRILIDRFGQSWNDAWDITRNTISYTNHTLLPEALETWPAALVERLLPRHLDIIYRINSEHLQYAQRLYPENPGSIATISMIDENAGRRVRMANVAFVGSHQINGVSAMHSELLGKTVFADLDKLYPGRIGNKTNGISFRRWLHQCNPELTNLLKDACGAAVIDDPSRLTRLERVASDTAFQEAFFKVRRKNKIALARMAAEQVGVKIDPSALFDVQIKRIHEYKRQLLNAVETVALYRAMRDNPDGKWTPRVKIFAGKAAASYHHAKLIIKLINDIATTVNNDASIRGLLKVVFMPNYNVSAAEIIIPATDLSEQISTAGMEASGTGNMKFALNGALTVGTLDGANIEIMEHVGEENIFIFGMKAENVLAQRQAGLDATSVIERSSHLSGAIDAIASGDFSGSEPDRFKRIAHGLRHADYYMVTHDFDAYFAAQRMIDGRWDTDEWKLASILNTARMGWFSADRTIREYAEDIWKIGITDPGQSA